MNKFIWPMLALVALGAGAGLWWQFSKNLQPDAGALGSAVGLQDIGKPVAVLNTNFGEIRFEIYESDAPKTADNFITLAKSGFYDGLTFHRVVAGFVIQGGDPNCGRAGSEAAPAGPCGAGGPGYVFEDELNPETASYKAGYQKGVVAMANAGPNTNGSQFFIMLEDNPLPHNYTIFGKVISGEGVVDAIGKTSVGQGDRPMSPVIINSVEILGK